MSREGGGSWQLISQHFTLHRRIVAKKIFFSLSFMPWRSWGFLFGAKSVRVVGLSRKIRSTTIFLLKTTNILQLKPFEDSREYFASCQRHYRRKELPISAAATIKNSSPAANNPSISWFLVYSKKSEKVRGFLVLRPKLVQSVSTYTRSCVVSKGRIWSIRIRWNLISNLSWKWRRRRSFKSIKNHSTP